MTSREMNLKTIINIDAVILGYLKNRVTALSLLEKDGEPLTLEEEEQIFKSAMHISMSKVGVQFSKMLFAMINLITKEVSRNV